MASPLKKLGFDSIPLSISKRSSSGTTNLLVTRVSLGRFRQEVFKTAPPEWMPILSPPGTIAVQIPRGLCSLAVHLCPLCVVDAWGVDNVFRWLTASAWDVSVP